MPETNALLKRLADGEDILVAEGYLFEFERRGYLKAGAFVPEVVLEHPDLVESVSREFVHSGSDVVLTFTYYGHREKLRLIGREHELELMNRKALEIAKKVARETGTLFAGNICNTTVYQPGVPEKEKIAEMMFKEQIEWAVEAGVDYILAETFTSYGETMLALECIKKYGKGIPAVTTMLPTIGDVLVDGVPIPEACRRLEEAGAVVVGVNCARGPATILPLMRKIREVCKGPLACLPVTYRTTPEHPTMMSLVDPYTGKQAFPCNLPGQQCGRSEIRDFGLACKEMGVQYVGLCCGNCSHFMREVAEAYGRKPPASKYSTDMSQHFVFGDTTKFSEFGTKNIHKALAGY